MPLFYNHTINENTKLAIWQISETESFFLEFVPLSRNITHPHKRLQHLAGRFILQFLFPDFPLHLIQIANTNKPFLENESHHFSISHCGDFAAAIVSTTHRVGIDIEKPTIKIDRVAHKFMHPNEDVVYKRFSPETRHITGTIYWCIKEAMYKWYSLGEVDFSEHLRVNEFKVLEDKTFIAITNFLKTNEPIILINNGKLWNDLILSWCIK